MNSRSITSSFAAALAVAVLVSTPPAYGQRKQAGAKNADTTPQSEMKKGGKPRVFVASAAGTNEGWTNDITRQTLEEALVNSGRFEVIAGTQRDNILREQGFSNSDLVDPAQAAKVGRMLSAKYIISGTCQSVTLQEKKSGMGGLGGRFGGRLGGAADSASSSSQQKVTARVQIQMTDLEKGIIVPNSTKSYTLDNSEKSNAFESRSTDDPKEAAYRTIIGNVATQYVADLSALVPIEALVISIQGNRVLLNQGSGAGVQSGMRFEVYSEGTPIKDPATGEVLDYDMTKYAVVRVSEVREKIAYADIEKTWADGGAMDPTPVSTRIEAQMSARAMSGGGGAAAVGDPGQGGGGKKKKNKDN